MRHLKAAFLILLLLPAAAGAQKKARKPSVPAVFDHARFVYVQAVDGEEFDRNLYPADRMAIADVRDALRAWGRYTLTVDRDKADLVFVVRKGRLASAEASGGISAGQDTQANGPIGQTSGRQRQQGAGPIGAGYGVGGEVGPPDDLFQVCQLTTDGKLSGPLWIHTFANGLDAPRLILFEQFKDAVEKAYPSGPQGTPASTPSKP